MKRAALYIRVSTQEQAQEGYSISEQKERLIAYCKAHDWLIADVYVDGGYSGSNLDRPGIKKLMDETDKFDVVLVYKLDRLSRSQRDTLYLIEEAFLPHDVDFVSMQESFDTATPFGKAMIGLLAVFAQLEREQIKERTRMGRIARAKSGLYRGGGNVPIGYDRIDGKLTINLYEAEQVRKIYDSYLAGLSIQRIRKLMAEAGYTTRYGNYSSWSTIRSILCNAVYTGRMDFGGITVEHAHEAIITKEQYQAARELQAKRHQHSSNFQTKNLLTGLLFCGHCGGRYYTKASSNRRYYSCYSRTKQMPTMIKDPNCKNKHWRKDTLEAIIDRKVREVLKSPELAAEIAASHKPEPVLSGKNADIEKRVKVIDKQIAKLMELYQHDDIPPNVLGESINKLYNEKTALEAAIVPDKEETRSIPFDLAQELIADAAQVWDFADEAQKRRILESLVSRIVLNGDDVTIEWAF